MNINDTLFSFCTLIKIFCNICKISPRFKNGYKKLLKVLNCLISNVRLKFFSHSLIKEVHAQKYFHWNPSSRSTDAHFVVWQFPRSSGSLRASQHLPPRRSLRSAGVTRLALCTWSFLVLRKRTLAFFLKWLIHKYWMRGWMIMSAGNCYLDSMKN